MASSRLLKIKKGAGRSFGQINVMKSWSWAVPAVVLVAVLIGFQLYFFRYEFMPLPNAGVMRVDRLTHRVCVAWPPDGTYKMSYCGRANH
jgi:hypothetical protein